jgi:ubiquinone/menaquinone biosynthesis C-methylase UbiE
MVPVLFQPWAAQLVDRASLSPGSRVLDLACGTGVIARIAAEEIGTGGQVVGIDLNPAMLSVARAVGQVSGAPIRWCRGDAEELALPDLSLDAVLCHQGFQFFPDRVKAALEMARVLRTGGRLALYVWSGPDRNPLAGALVAALRNAGLPTCCRAMRRPFSVRDQREITAPIEGAGFRILIGEVSRLWITAVDAEEFLHGFLRAMPFSKEIPVQKIELLVCDAIFTLSPYIQRRALRVPSHAHTVVAVRDKS